MSARATQIPGSVLLAVPVAAWTLLLAVDIVLTVQGEPPSTGLHGTGIAIVVTLTLTSLVLWSLGRSRAHVSAELEEVRTNFSHDLAMFFQMMSRRIDSRIEFVEARLDNLEAPTQPIHLAAAVGMAHVPEPSAPPPDNVISFELGRQIGRREQQEH